MCIDQNDFIAKKPQGTSLLYKYVINTSRVLLINIKMGIYEARWVQELTTTSSSVVIYQPLHVTLAMKGTREGERGRNVTKGQ